MEGGSWLKHDVQRVAIQFTKDGLVIQDKYHRDGHLEIPFMQEELAPYNIFSVPQVKAAYPLGGRCMLGDSKGHGCNFHGDATDSILHYFFGHKILFAIVGENGELLYRNFFEEWLKLKCPNEQLAYLLKHPRLRWIHVWHGSSLFIKTGVPHASVAMAGVNNCFIASWFLSITSALQVYDYQAFWWKTNRSEHDLEKHLLPLALPGAALLAKRVLEAEPSLGVFIIQEVKEFVETLEGCAKLTGLLRKWQKRLLPERRETGERSKTSSTSSQEEDFEDEGEI